MPHINWLMNIGPAVAFIAAFASLFLFKNKELRQEIGINVGAFFLLYFMRKTVFITSFVRFLPHPAKGFFEIPFSGANILIYFVVADFTFYVTHRLTHTIPLLWMAHSGHHSAKKMHLSAILRGSALDLFLFFPIPTFIATAFVGFYPLPFFFCYRLVFLYQAFTHTEYFGRWKYVDRILITPHTHILHHNLKAPGAFSNYGGILAIWDWMFGTLCTGPNSKEYGIRDLNDVPYNFWTAQLYVPYKILMRCSEESSLRPLFTFRRPAKALEIVEPAKEQRTKN